MYSTTDIIAFLALIVSVSAAIWTIGYNLIKVKAEKIERTLDLQFRYHDSDMMIARNTGWYLIESFEESNEPLTFKGLWDHEDNSVRKKFNQLHKVMNLWFILYHLGEQKKIDIKLGKKIFTYEYDWWFWRLERLTKDTEGAASRGLEPMPDVLKPFLGKGINWIQRKPVNEEQWTRKVAAD